MALDQFGRDLGSLVNPQGGFQSLSQLFAGIGRAATPAPAVGANTSALPGAQQQQLDQQQGRASTPSTAMSGTTRVIDSTAPVYTTTPYTGGGASYSLGEPAAGSK